MKEYCAYVCTRGDKILEDVRTRVFSWRIAGCQSDNMTLVDGAQGLRETLVARCEKPSVDGKARVKCCFR